MLGPCINGGILTISEALDALQTVSPTGYFLKVFSSVRSQAALSKLLGQRMVYFIVRVALGCRK